MSLEEEVGGTLKAHSSPINLKMNNMMGRTVQSASPRTSLKITAKPSSTS